MPYRRLPKTDQARLHALRKAIQQSELSDFGDPVIAYKTIIDAKNFLSLYEKQLAQYQQMLINQVAANKKYQQIVHNVRLYISHFIQVLNLAVIRGDIKKEHKNLYHLNPDVHTVPSLNTEASLLKWGKNIIDGENERLRQGGLAIYNPTIAKVKVHYEIFKDYKDNQKLHQSTTNRNWEDLYLLREKGDRIIFDIWNQVEEKFNNEKPYIRLLKCKEFGLIYYYRKGEPEVNPEDDAKE